MFAAVFIAGQGPRLSFAVGALYTSLLMSNGLSSAGFVVVLANFLLKSDGLSPWSGISLGHADTCAMTAAHSNQRAENIIETPHTRCAA